MSRNCDSLTDRDINTAIQEHLARERRKYPSNQKTITVYLEGVLQHITTKYSCSYTETFKGKAGYLLQKAVDQQNKFSGGSGQLIKISSSPSPSSSSFTFIPPPQETRTSLASEPKPPLKTSISSIEDSSLRRTPFPPDSWYSSSKYGLPPYPVRHKWETRSPPLSPLAPTTMAEYYDGVPNDKFHGKLSCREDASCPVSYACDLDTMKCLSVDRLPVHQITSYKDKIITGSGKSIVEHYLSKGVPLSDILDGKVPRTLFSDNYVQAIKKEKSREGHLEMKNLPTVFTQVMSVRNITIDLSGWPEGLTMVPDFLDNNSEQNLIKKIESFEGNGPDSRKLVRENGEVESLLYGYAIDPDSRKLVRVDDPPSVLKCIADFLYQHKFISTYPNQITVNKYLPGQGIPSHVGHADTQSEIVGVSLGSPVLMVFEKGSRKVEIPLVPGSLFVISGEAKSWSHSMAARAVDTYERRGMPPQSWKRDSRMSLTFRTVMT